MFIHTRVRCVVSLILPLFILQQRKGASNSLLAEQSAIFI